MAMAFGHYSGRELGGGIAVIRGFVQCQRIRLTRQPQSC